LIEVNGRLRRWAAKAELSGAPRESLNRNPKIRHMHFDERMLIFAV
jgi:hypothetical protein